MRHISAELTSINLDHDHTHNTFHDRDTDSKQLEVDGYKDSYSESVRDQTAFLNLSLCKNCSDYKLTIVYQID